MLPYPTVSIPLRYADNCIGIHYMPNLVQVSIPLRYADNRDTRCDSSFFPGVSIPLRYADNNRHSSRFHPLHGFQFLLGTLITLFFL